MSTRELLTTPVLITHIEAITTVMLLATGPRTVFVRYVVLLEDLRMLNLVIHGVGEDK